MPDIPKVPIPSVKKTVPLLNNCYMINLIGSDTDMEQATNEIKDIAEEMGHTVKVVEIRPDGLLSTNASNEAPKWRVKLSEEVKSNENILINKVGQVNCEIITDLNRSVRAVSNDFRHPWAFKIDPNVKTRHESVLLGTHPYKFNCDQINQVYPLKGTYETKRADLDTYLRVNYV